MKFSFDPQSFARALEFLLWWQWIAIATWGWGLIWLLEGRPWGFGAFAARIPSHPVITGIASFATVWGSLTFINCVYRRFRLSRLEKRKKKPTNY
jgi:hypothetical protein